MGITIWHDGALRSADEAIVTGLDHGLTVGDGVFETCAVYSGRPFALTRHLRRLARSAAGLGLTRPDEDAIRAGIAAVLAASGPDTGRLRVTITGGPGPLGSHRNAPGDERQTVIVLAGPGARPRTARVARVPWVRNERSAVAGLKTTSYAENVVALARAVATGADEALLANSRGELCEGTGSNVFVERDGELLTPPLTSGALAGITRELALEWALDEGLPVREAHAGELDYSVLDEVAQGRGHLALSSTIRNVVPVVAIDGVPLATGELSAIVQMMFERRVADDLDP